MGGVLMRMPGLLDMETRGEVQDLAPALDRHHPPRGEGAAIARAVDLEDHRLFGVAGAHEIGMQRMAGPILRHRMAGGHQRLRHHLAAKDAPRRLAAAPRSAKQVGIEPFDIEKPQQGRGRVSHAPRLRPATRAVERSPCKSRRNAHFTRC